MAFKRRDIAFASFVAFVAWGYVVNWFPALHRAGQAFVLGVVCAFLALLALIGLTSRQIDYHATHSRMLRRHGAVLTCRNTWKQDLASWKSRQIRHRTLPCIGSARISAALDEVLDLIMRDFVKSWFNNISPNPIFPNEVDKAISTALVSMHDRLDSLDLVQALTAHIIPLLTAHFRNFYEAERSVRGRKLNRAVTESDELDIAIASKYRGGQLHPAASLAYSDTKMLQQDYLRKVTGKILPQLLPPNLLASRPVATLIVELVTCAVLFPVMQMLSNPDTWNQIMENYGRTMLQDRSTVRKLRAALDQHASPSPKQSSSKLAVFPRLASHDGERKFEKFIRAIRKINNLSDARRFRSEVTSQLKRDAQQESTDPVYLKRLDMGKRMLDQKVQALAAPGGSERRTLPNITTQVQLMVARPSLPKLENASLIDLLRDPAGLSYFMEYMDRQRLMSLVQFWLVVDGFRDPLDEDGPEPDYHLPRQLAPWTESDRLDLAQIDAAYLSRPELKVPEASKQTVQEFLRTGKNATSQQYDSARRAILRAQSAVLEEMRMKHFQNFKKSDLFYKCLAAEEAANKSMPPPTSPAHHHPHPPPPPPPTHSMPLPTGPSRPAHRKALSVSRFSSKLQPPMLANQRAGSFSDLSTANNNPKANRLPEGLRDARRSFDDDLLHHSSLFDGGGDDQVEDSLANSTPSLVEPELASPQAPDTQVVKAMEEALNDILENSERATAEDLRESLFGPEDATSSLFPEPLGSSPLAPALFADDGSHAPLQPPPPPKPQIKTKSLFDDDLPGLQPPPTGLSKTAEQSSTTQAPKSAAGGSRNAKLPTMVKEGEIPSLASLGLVSPASRIGVFVDDDLFDDEDKYVSGDDDGGVDGTQAEDDIDAVHEAAPGDLELAEAISALTNDIDRLLAQNAVIDSLTRKAELTNHNAELRILRKSKASLQRELRRKELQRQQYMVQESDNSLYGRSTIKIKSIQVGREGDGREYALYVVEVSRNAGEKMPAAIWVVTKRYSEFLDLHQKLRSRYPSVRDLDFPRRRMVMKLQSEFLRKRRLALEKYLSELLLLPEVCRSRDLRAFLSQSSVHARGEELGNHEDKKDMITRLYDSVTDGVEDILGSIPVLDQLSLAGQNLIAAATNQLNAMPLSAGDDESGFAAAEAEAELKAFDDGGNKDVEPFVKPICDIFLEIFELNRGNNWLRGRAVVVVLHQLLGSTIERKLRDNIKMATAEDAVLRYVRLLRDAVWPGPGRELVRDRPARTAAQKMATRREASLTIATLVPDLAGSVVGRLNAQAASRRIFATFNNTRLNAHLAFTLLDETIDILFSAQEPSKLR